jgi:hypothetical protein
MKHHILCSLSLSYEDTFLCPRKDPRIYYPQKDSFNPRKDNLSTEKFFLGMLDIYWGWPVFTGNNKSG